MKTHFIIGTRGSDLALWQAYFVKGEVERLGYTCELNIIKTKGDQIQHLSFDKIEGKGFFTKEIEDALLLGHVDLAVHSHKDLETSQPEGLAIAAVSERADPSDVLLIRKECVDASQPFHLKLHAQVGTSSSRRKSLMKHFRPDTLLVDIRGNVPTRIDKLRSGQFDAILMAKAGLDRLALDLSDLHVVRLNPEDFVPAPAQGVLALQCRKDDRETFDMLSRLNAPEVAKLIHIERTVLQRMEGGCHLPLGVYATYNEEEYTVFVSYAPTWDAPLRSLTFISNDHLEIPEFIIKEIKTEA